ncbi:histidine triad nucleotide-binding protein [Solimicrobium silvestre]|uniref:Diadenosine tetraphosphate (Ap4A) hydrolase and other HIT family hydrolase n=1 Tax=Solimicrobium silvestre TaxID=2099400 RepID=A0A2S9H1Z8_9BURK|nr:histidine triad nucleotide-binding protein [Solimicrobium silvestre]PRC93999.1 Diadenosine tetraphosphate (Ap4A) hydrolase and other HIT family hydrolase [Solimicrobium silvestre]
MENCLFCKIAAGTVPAQKVYEDAEFLAFNDIFPAAPIHLLIIPKHHVATLSDCTSSDTELLGRMLALVPKLAEQQGCHVQLDDAGNRIGGYKTLINSGPDGGQEVYHLHVHVIGGPRPWHGKNIQI